MPSNYEDEDYFLPLEDQRVFGAGISRKRVPFVRSSDHELNTTTASTSPSTPCNSSSVGLNIANKYLSIVMPKTTTIDDQPEAPATLLRPATAPPTIQTTTPPNPTTTTTTTTTKCEICNLPLSSLLPTENNQNRNRPHEASLAHQVCLTHSHPPSHLDRTRPGLRYLESYGWDPDSRLGLGAPGREGIREPVKGRLKVDTVGLGVVSRDDDANDNTNKKKMKKTLKAEKKPQKLNAKDVRRGQAEAKIRGEKLREMFYTSEDVLRYLGSS